MCGTICSVPCIFEGVLSLLHFSVFLKRRDAIFVSIATFSKFSQHQWAAGCTAARRCFILFGTRVSCSGRNGCIRSTTGMACTCFTQGLMARRQEEATTSAFHPAIPGRSAIEWSLSPPNDALGRFIGSYDRCYADARLHCYRREISLRLLLWSCTTRDVCVTA